MCGARPASCPKPSTAPARCSAHARCCRRGPASSSVALDEVAAWQIPKATLQALLSANPAFCAAVFAEIARRLSRHEARSEQREFLSLMMARVRDAFVRKPFYVDGALDLVSRVPRCCPSSRPEQCAGARRRAHRHVHHHRPARRAAAPPRRQGATAAAAGGARRGALRAGLGRRRRRTVRGAAADDPPPRAPRAGARRRRASSACSASST